MIVCDLEVDAGNGFAEIVAELVAVLAREAALPADKAYWLRLATEELVTNVARHGYRGRGPVWISGGVARDRVWVRIEDAAPTFDPSSHTPRPQPMTRQCPEVAGGYGLLLAMRGVDRFHYERVDGRNRSTLSVFRAADD
jgi:anti-sigma regulatory factor (Ser/Thr protein kinase)